MQPIKLSEFTDVLEFDSDEYVNLVDLQNGRVVSVERSDLSAAEEGDEDSLGVGAGVADSDRGRHAKPGDRTVI